ncbi:hypothetical protein ACVWXQ_003269 [Bradyrhizobium sp. S3.14.4]
MAGSGMVRAAAIPVGCIIALASICLTLVKRSAKDLLAVGVLFAAIAGVLYLAGPSLKSLGNWNLLIFFVGLLGCAVMAGVPIAFSFCLATVAFLLTTTRTPLLVVVGRIDEGMSSLILLAVPLFVLLGQLVEQTGMARVMVAFLASVLGHVRGGLSYVMLGAMLLVSGISGSKTADMAAIAPVLFPEMRKRGMKDGELVSLLAASGAMSETIPPSIVLIAIASVTGVSIAALFTAGILPGIVLAIVLGFVARYRAGAEENAALKIARAPMSVVAKTLWVALPALTLPFLIRSAVVEGYATATEVSTIGIAYCLVLGLIIYRGSLVWKNVLPMLVQTRLAVRVDPVHRGCGERDGLGAGAIRLLARSGGAHGWRAGRSLRLPTDLGGRLHRARQRAGGDSGHRAVRPAAVPGGRNVRHQRGPLCDGGDPGDGSRPVRAAIRPLLLRSLQHRRRVAGCRHAPDLDLSRLAVPGPAADHLRALDIAGVSMRFPT